MADTPPCAFDLAIGALSLADPGYPLDRLVTARWSSPRDYSAFANIAHDGGVHIVASMQLVKSVIGKLAHRDAEATMVRRKKSSAQKGAAAPGGREW
jgi:hypothetical protein